MHTVCTRIQLWGDGGVHASASSQHWCFSHYLIEKSIPRSQAKVEKTVPKDKTKKENTRTKKEQLVPAGASPLSHTNLQTNQKNKEEKCQELISYDHVGWRVLRTYVRTHDT